MPVAFLLFQALAFPFLIVALFYRWLTKEMRNEIYWFVTRVCYPMTITSIAINATLGGSWISRICLPFWIIMWVQDYKDDHDDRWKKRRKKVLGKVKVVGRRLVVVPISN